MKVLNIIALLLIFASAFSQTPDAVYHKIHKTYTLNTDGTYVYEYTHQLKYNSYFAFHRLYGETFVVYDPKIQEVKVLECKTTMADGKVIHAPQNAFNEVLPSFAKSSGTYNHLRELVITHTGLEVGAVVDLSYKINHNENPKGFFAGMELLSYSSPVNELIITFNVPSETTISFSGNVGERIINENDDVRSYVFIYKNLNEAPKGHYLDVDENTILSYNTGKPLNQQLKDILIDKEAVQDVKYQYANADNLTEISTIHENLLQQVKTIPIPTDFQQYPVSVESEIERRNSGTPLEKALLLRKQLLAKNIAASLAISLPTENSDPITSSLCNVSEFYVMVPHENGEPILLPITHKPHINEIYANYQNTIFILDENFDFFRLLPKTTNYADLKVDLTLENANAKISYQSNIAGIFSPWINSAVSANKIFDDVKQEENIERTGSDPFSIQLKGTFTSSIVNKGVFIEVPLPQYKTGFRKFSPSSFPSDVKYAIKTNYPVVENYTYTIDLSGYKIIQKPENFSIANEFMNVDIKTIEENQKLHITMRFNIESMKIPSNHYDDFRRAIITFNKESNKTVILRKE